MSEIKGNHPMRILVLDDHIKSAENAETAVRQACADAGILVDVIRLPEAEQKDLIKQVEDANPEQPDFKAWLDRANALADARYDIAIVDLRWRALQGHGMVTGEDIALHLRLFAGISTTVILNKFFETDFDLSMVEEVGSHGDVHISADLLKLQGLWKLPSPPNDDQVPQFRPWHWPVLPQAVFDVARCRDDLKDQDFSTPVLEYFGFNEQRYEALGREARGCLDPTVRDPGQTNFISFLLYGCLGTPRDLRDAIAKGVEANCEAARIVAVRLLVAELRHWLSRMVLAPQDVLIDSPHLAQRMPWIVDGDIGDLSTWNSFVMNDSRAFKPVAAKARFEKEHWLSRSAFWLPDLQDNSDIDKLFKKYKAQNKKRFVFLEDRSCFVAVEQAEPFKAAFESVWASRHVWGGALEDAKFRYAPKSRFL